MKKFVLTMIVLSATNAWAQPVSNDTEFLKRAISALQLQRNQALDAQVIAEAQRNQLSEELNKLQARVKELEAKQSEEK